MSDHKHHKTKEANAAAALLEKFKATSPVFPNDWGVTHVIRSDTPFPEAVNRLTKAEVMAMPVVDPVSGKMLCWFGVEDLVGLLLDRVEDGLFAKHDVHELVALHDDLQKSTLAQLQNSLTPIGCSVKYSEDVSMLDATKAMSKAHRHRIVVLDDEGRPKNVLSQSRLIAIAGVVLEDMLLGKKTIGELGIGTYADQGEGNNLALCKETDTARKAFDLMGKDKVSAVGVVNSEGKLVGNISMRDVKQFGYGKRFYGLLGESLLSWLTQIRRCDPRRTIADDQDPIRVKVTAKFGEVVSLINHYRIHRVWIVNDKDEPIGVLSLTDIAHMIFGHSSFNLVTEQ